MRRGVIGVLSLISLTFFYHKLHGQDDIRIVPAKPPIVQTLIPDMQPGPLPKLNLEMFFPFPDSICIIGTGDIMLGTNYPSLTYLPPDAAWKGVLKVNWVTLKSARTPPAVMCSACLHILLPAFWMRDMMC
jgi:hypothetical protein